MIRDTCVLSLLPFLLQIQSKLCCSMSLGLFCRDVKLAQIWAKRDRNKVWLDAYTVRRLLSYVLGAFYSKMKL